MGGLSDAVASAARAAGVEIRTNCTVDHIAIRDSKAQGIVLDSGEEIRGQAIVSNATAYVTFNDLIQADVFNTNEAMKDLKEHILRMDYTSGTTKINLALSGVPYVESAIEGALDWTRFSF